MNGLFRPRNLAIAGGAGVFAFFVLPKTSAGKLNPLNTPGVQNIENRWSSGGGGTKHTPGVATPRGNAEISESNQTKPRGISTDHYKENVSDQRPSSDQNKLTEKWWETQHGNAKGK